LQTEAPFAASRALDLPAALKSSLLAALGSQPASGAAAAGAAGCNARTFALPCTPSLRPPTRTFRYSSAHGSARFSTRLLATRAHMPGAMPQQHTVLTETMQHTRLELHCRGRRPAGPPRGSRRAGPPDAAGSTQHTRHTHTRDQTACGAEQLAARPGAGAAPQLPRAPGQRRSAHELGATSSQPGHLRRARLACLARHMLWLHTTHDASTAGSCRHALRGPGAHLQYCRPPGYKSRRRLGPCMHLHPGSTTPK
jgi:hypothetical protein